MIGPMTGSARSVLPAATTRSTRSAQCAVSMLGAWPKVQQKRAGLVQDAVQPDRRFCGVQIRIGHPAAQQRVASAKGKGHVMPGDHPPNQVAGFLLGSHRASDGHETFTGGNHDFDYGLEGIEKQLPHANFPFLIANYDFSETILRNKFQPYKIFMKDMIKVGVFGLGIELNALVPDKLFGATKYLDPISIAQDLVKELQKQKCIVLEGLLTSYFYWNLLAIKLCRFK